MKKEKNTAAQVGPLRPNDWGGQTNPTPAPHPIPPVPKHPEPPPLSRPPPLVRRPAAAAA
jgi:hypothetical protein